MTLEDLGWDAHFAESFAAGEGEAKGWVPARLSQETKINFTAILGDGEQLEVVLSGKVWHDAATDADLPAVGDWVALDLDAGTEPIIREILPRKSRFSRKAPLKAVEEQVIAANVDVIMVVTDPGDDFNLGRLERFHMLIGRSGAQPVIILNKCDLHEEARISQCVEQLEALGDDLQVHVLSATEGTGAEALDVYFQQGRTVALCGSSGVGKSTLVNRFLGEDYLWTDTINARTGKGRHTTVARELVLLPGGGLLIDNPGIREVQMWTDETVLRESFADIEELVSDCRFKDCKHRSDLGCAIRAAHEGGTIDRERYDRYLNLETEIAELKRLQKKRQCAVERWAKRNHRVKARNRADRDDEEDEFVR